jgi:hypothetical protein
MMREQERFSPAEELWDLERLYADLAKCKGKSLTPMERLHLKGLLCGYSPKELATKLNKDNKGLETDLSSTIYLYIKELVGKKQQKIENWRIISDWLEQIGYKKPVVSPNQDEEGTTIIPLKSLDGLFKISHNNFSNCVTVEIHVNFPASLLTPSIQTNVSSSPDSNDPNKVD